MKRVSTTRRQLDSMMNEHDDNISIHDILKDILDDENNNMKKRVRKDDDDDNQEFLDNFTLSRCRSSLQYIVDALYRALSKSYIKLSGI